MKCKMLMLRLFASATLISFISGCMSDTEISTMSNGILELQPEPKEMRLEGELNTLPFPVRIILPENPTEIEQTASAMLARHLKERFQVLATETRGIKKLLEGSSINLSNLKLEKSQEYQMDITNTGGKCAEITVKGAGIGLMYGVATLLETLQQATIKNNFVLSAPEKLRLRDWPSIRERIRTSGANLEAMIWQRINAFHLKPYTPNLAKRVAAAKKYGIKVYGNVSQIKMTKKLGRTLCPSNPKDVAMVENSLEKLAKAGCEGYEFYFDDLGGQNTHPRKCAKCAEKFSTLGKSQKFWLEIMVRVGEKYGIKDYVAVCTPYMRNWQRNIKVWGAGLFENYFKDLTGSPMLDNVAVGHCEYSPKGLADLKKAGVKKHMFFINGLWGTTRFFTWSTGIDRLAWQWYAFKFDPEKGAVPIPEAIEDLKNLSKHMDCVFYGTSAWDGLFIGGNWAWNPKKYDDNKARRAAVNFLYGRDLLKYFDEYEKNMLKLSAFFTTGSVALSECKIEILKEDKDRLGRADEMRDYLNSAKAALKGLKKAMISQVSEPLLRSVRLPFAKPSVKRFERDIASLKKKIDALYFAKDRRTRLGGKRPQYNDLSPIALYTFDDPKNPVKDSSSNNNSGKLTGKPESVKSLFGNALRFHGGKFSNISKKTIGSKEFIVIPFKDSMNVGDKSFSVICWVKMDGKGAYNKIVGDKNTCARHYISKGWSIGIAKDGVLRFIVDDGKKKYTAKTDTGKEAEWFDGEWNCIVAVRDTSKHKISLYVNGVLASEVDDKTKDITTKSPIVIGLDGMAGTYMKGEIDELCIIGKALSPKEIKSNYTQTLKKR